MIIGLTAHATLFTLSAIGISETVYLIEKRKKLEQPVCPIGKDCSKVLESKYNHLFGLHNDVVGLVFYIATALLTALLVIGWLQNLQTYFDLTLRLMVVAAAGTSFFFTYLQWRVIRAWCFWCVMSAITVLGMFVIVLLSV